MSISPSTRWLSVAALVFVVTVICGLGLIAVTPKVYVATAQIQIRPRAINNVGLSGDGSFDSMPRSAELQIIQSTDILVPIITDLELDKKWAKRSLPAEHEVFMLPDAINYLRSHLKVDFVRGTNNFTISFFDDNPTEATNIANAIADRYKVMRDVEEDQRTHRGLDSLREQIGLQEKAVADAQAAVDKIKKDLDISGSTEEWAHQDLDTMKQDLLTAQEDYDARRVFLEHMSKLPDDEHLKSTLGPFNGLPNFVGLLQGEIRKLKTDISNLLDRGVSASDSRVASLQAQLDARNKQLADFVAGLRRAMQADLDMAGKRVALLQQQVDTLEAKEDSEPRLRTLRDAERTLKQAQALLDALNVRLKQVVSDSSLMQSPVRIIARAEPPSHPIQPDVPLDLLLFAVAGLELSVAIASFVELLIWLRRWSPQRRRVARGA